MIFGFLEWRENKPGQHVPERGNPFCLGCAEAVADLFPPDQRGAMFLEAVLFFRFFCQKRIKSEESMVHS
jgi:hypothetical protein